MVRSSRVWRVLGLGLAAAMLVAVAGCGATTTTGVDEPGGIPDDPEIVNEQAQDADLIPPGREIAEGGGGPTQYTFREEWRRALPEAQKWRIGAYLISAVGNQVNDDGVPSDWRFAFISDRDPDALLFIYMDPWGKVSSTEEVTENRGSHVSEYDRPMEYDVIDSDQAVSIALKALAEDHDLADTKDPRISLGWSVLDGSGPYWEFNIFHKPTATYLYVQIDARSGAVTRQE